MLTKILIAKAENGEVTVEAGKVPGAQILSAGKAASNGILIISEGNKIYFALPMDSISGILDLMSELSNTLGTGIAASNGGGAIAPTLATDMQALIQKINQLKENLQ